MIKGIDISSWQDSVPSFDGDFIILRAGYSTVKDPKFDEHYKNAIKLNKRVGVYWYSYALNKEQAIKEAQKCLDVVKGKNITMGIWFDMEDADQYKKKNGFKFDRLTISGICDAFCEIVEGAGYYAGIYASYHYMKTYISCPKYDKWIAYWGSNDGNIPSGMENTLRSMGGSIWQYTSKLGGKNLDGDVLLHNNLYMYDIHGSKPKKDFDSLAKELKNKINTLIDEFIRSVQE